MNVPGILPTFITPGISSGAFEGFDEIKDNLKPIDKSAYSTHYLQSGWWFNSWITAQDQLFPLVTWYILNIPAG